MSDPQTRIAVVVLGMHRSGTTALTRVLALAGADLPKELREADEVGGRGGNWEARAITLFDDEALEAAGTAWDHPVKIDESWFDSPAAAGLVEGGAELVADQYGSSPLCVVKDPRVSRLVPLWNRILERAGFDPRFALLTRNPVEVADSLEARNEFARNHSLLLWLRYVLDAEQATRGRPRSFLTYDGLLDDWRGGIASLRSHLQLAPDALEPADDTEIDDALSTALRHHWRQPDDLGNESELDRWVAATDSTLLAAARGETDGIAAALDPLRADLDANEAIFRPALDRHGFSAQREIDRSKHLQAVAEERAADARAELRRAREKLARARSEAKQASARARALEREISQVRSSASWRITTPLRRLAGARTGGASRLKPGQRNQGRAADDPPPEHPPAPFVIGVGRSGTTMLRLMLDAHPDLAIPPETRFVPRLIRAARQRDATAEGLVDLLTQERNWADFGLERDDVLERMPADAIDPGAAVRAFYTAYAARFAKSRWGDKTPPYGSRMPAIANAVPEARFVHLIRDPRDVAASWRRFRQGRGDDPLKAEHWAQVWSATIIETRIKASQVRYYREVRYEDLVASPEQTLRDLCDFLELPFDARMLSYHESAPKRMAELASGLPPTGGQPARSASDRLQPHELTSLPPQPDRVGAWREELDAAEVAQVEGVTADLLEDVGGTS